jgi:hypothetical protein
MNYNCLPCDVHFYRLAIVVILLAFSHTSGKSVITLREAQCKVHHACIMNLFCYEIKITISFDDGTFKIIQQLAFITIDDEHSTMIYIISYNYTIESLRLLV